ncbi:hypothetical protein O181_002295 [Austropuccinia psidii MF-1]|uniref:Tf2-1-like SH3-like domain-containing protein n=1 Tax=Austropuccinia psidii MF-1 TaxID=1389203 RepID=A0A9Q3GCP4_9BASI|nr:hypothetical protein [Austropuccinia psidii MF-1]
MDRVTALPPGGDRSFNECLVLVDRYSKPPFHKDDTAMDPEMMIWNRVISHNGLFQNIITYHPQKDGLAVIIIQTLEEIIEEFCAYGLEFKDSDGFTHDLCSILPALELAYKTSIHSSAGKTTAMLEKGLNPRLPYGTLKKELVDINPTERSFKIMLDKERHNANRCMQDSFKYSKEGWDKSHKPCDWKVRDLVLLSTLKLNKIKCPKKLKDSFEGPFMIKELHGTNSVQLELPGELMNKHPTFPLSLIKPYSSQVIKSYFP